MKVEIKYYRAMEKGSLRGFFTLVVNVGEADEYMVIDCRHFESKGAEWFAFPQKTKTNSPSDKPEYISYVRYTSSGYMKELTKAVVDAIKNQPKSNYVKEASSQETAYNVPRNTSSVWI